MIVLDQFSRNLYRDTSRMFDWDDQALALTHAGLEAGEQSRLLADEQVFLLMPLMHSESLDDQDRCVRALQLLADSLPTRARARIENNVEFARAHRDIIARFGRFPHRNALLGRPSTPQEISFLRQPGSSF